jgi:hypothetical protein
MRLVQRSLEKYVLEVSSKEIDKKGFDFIWDRIREAYSVNKFDILSIKVDKDNENIVFIELVPKK